MADERTQDQQDDEDTGGVQGFFNWIGQKLKDIGKLTIITAVGNFDVSFESSGQEGGELDKATVSTAGSKAMVSVIDLVDGDIKSLLHEDFVTGELTELRQFHQDREQSGRQIITDNIETLKSLIRLAIEVRDLRQNNQPQYASDCSFVDVESNEY